jgi:hypothetical protein
MRSNHIVCGDAATCDGVESEDAQPRAATHSIVPGGNLPED